MEGTLMQDYEQQYAVLTADITSKIGLLQSAGSGEQKQLVLVVDRLIEEVQELLEQMELEARGVDPNTRPKYRARIDSYKAELGRLSLEFMKVRTPPYMDGLYPRDEFFGEGVNLNDEQKQRLLNNSERIERTGNQLKSSYRIILETEEIGNQVLRDLELQRETIQKTRSRIKESENDLEHSTRILLSMFMRSIQQRAVLIIIGVIFILVIIITVYFSVTKNN